MQGILTRKSSLKDIPTWCVLKTNLLQLFKAQGDKDSVLGSVHISSLVFKKIGERSFSLQCGDMKPLTLVAKTTYTSESWLRALNFAACSALAAVTTPGSSRLSFPNLWLRELQDSPLTPLKLKKSSSTTTVPLNELDNELGVSTAEATSLTSPQKRPIVANINLSEIRADSHKHSLSASDKEELIAKLDVIAGPAVIAHATSSPSPLSTTEILSPRKRHQLADVAKPQPDDTPSKKHHHHHRDESLSPEISSSPSPVEVQSPRKHHHHQLALQVDVQPVPSEAPKHKHHKKDSDSKHSSHSGGSRDGSVSPRPSPKP